jgi:glucose/arabinose dehydrogenase
MKAHNRRVLLAGITVVGTLAGAVIGAQPSGAAPSITPWITGLNAPRGVAFDAQGSLYVSESGTAGDGPAGLTHTGRVSKYKWHSSTPAWQTGFDSLFVSIDPSQPPDVLGPAGISAFGNGCMNNSHGQRNGCQVLMITGESHDGVAAATDGAVDAQQAGHLFRLDGATGRATDKADVGDQQYQWTSDHSALFPDDFPDANPFGVLVTKGAGGIRTFVADAGANTISEVMSNGATRVISYIPNETAPPFRDATPTCIAQGPDGMLYVATLNLVSGFVNGPGHANVWRVNPNANYPTAPTLWATGLTSATGCTFDRAGNFWATEMFAPNPAGPPGDLVRIPFSDPSHLDHIGLGSLPLPGNVAQGPDGAMYVSINTASSAPDDGAVVRVTG